MENAARGWLWSLQTDAISTLHNTPNSEGATHLKEVSVEAAEGQALPESSRR
jgi:hypothetical protein